MSAYTDLVLGGLSFNPAFYHPLNDAAGSSTYADLAQFNLPLTTNGTVIEGAGSIVPGDPSNTSIEQATSKNSQMAARSHNAIFDSASAALTCCAWIRPDTLKSAGMPIISKGQYGLVTAFHGALTAKINGQTDLSSATDRLVPGNVYFVAQVFSGTGQTWKSYINGKVAASRNLPSGQTITSSSSALEIGGSLSTFGFGGGIQHVAIFHAALPDSDIQKMYALGAVAPDVVGAFSFPSVISPVNPSGLPRRIVNTSDTALYVAEDNNPAVLEAVYGTGWRVPPRGGSERITSTKQLSGIHGGVGAK